MNKDENLKIKQQSKPALEKGFDEFYLELDVTNQTKKENNGLDAKAVESVVFGCQSENNEDALLQEIAKVKDSGEVLQKTELETDFSKVPQLLVFSELSTFKLYKRASKREFYINGKMLESRIGLDYKLYEKVKSRSSSAFCVGDDIVVFYSAKVNP